MEHDVIAQAVFLVLAAAVIAYACLRLGLVPIVGFLVAGVVIGPHGLGLVRDHVGCCDSSPQRHGRAQWQPAAHPIMCSLEPGETWGWCFVDEVEL